MGRLALPEPYLPLNRWAYSARRANYSFGFVWQFLVVITLLFPFLPNEMFGSSHPATLFANLYNFP